MKHSFRLAPIALAIGALAASISLTTQTAAAETAPNPNPAAVEAGAYSIDSSHTQATFAVSHFGFNDYYGEFTGATGTLTLDPETPAASQLEVSIPTANIATANQQLNEILRSAAWFDAAKFPTISFKSTAIVVTAPGRAAITGNLTLHGVTRPVTLAATFNAAGINPLNKAYTAGFHVSGQIKRSDFGITAYLPAIGDEVTLTISAAFEKTPG